MAPLPASTFFISGAIISIISLFTSTLRPFIVLGIIFILIGVVKAIKNKPRTHRDTYNTQPAQTSTPAEVKRCFVCSAKNHSQANFCGHCGHKLS